MTKEQYEGLWREFKTLRLALDNGRIKQARYINLSTDIIIKMNEYIKELHSRDNLVIQNRLIDDVIRFNEDELPTKEDMSPKEDKNNS